MTDYAAHTFKDGWVLPWQTRSSRKNHRKLGAIKRRLKADFRDRRERHVRFVTFDELLRQL